MRRVGKKMKSEATGRSKNRIIGIILIFLGIVSFALVSYFGRNAIFFGILAVAFGIFRFAARVDDETVNVVREREPMNIGFKIFLLILFLLVVIARLLLHHFLMEHPF